MSTSAAVIDIGTTSTNLLIADENGEIERHVTVTRLGEGVDATRTLLPTAIARTMEVLRSYNDRIERCGVSRVRLVATSACRDATNRDVFFDEADALFGVRPELLSGEEEARASFGGALFGLTDPPGPSEIIAVIDIGGGSTELVVGRGDGTVIGGTSIDLGARRLTELDLTHDPARPEELTNAIGRMTDEVEDAIREIPELSTAGRWVGVASTITVVAAVELGLAEWRPDLLHGFVLTRDAAEDVFRTLATEPRADRIHNPGLPAERADVIVGGCCALVGVMRRLQLPSITVSLTNLLDGIARQMLAEHTS